MKVVPIVFAIGLLAALLLLVSGPGARFGAWDFGFGFTLLRGAFYVGAAAAVLSAILLLVPTFRSQGAVKLGVALVLGAIAAWVPWNGLQTARSVPPIHDITTDTLTPPAFVDIAPLRADAPNPVSYEGEVIAEQQRDAYPDLQTIELSLAPAEAFERASQAAHAQGWDIVAEAPADGRIEASDTTFWFGFIDDVVIRIEPSNGGSKLDIRSKSRVGRSDVGANAARIRAFLETLDAG